jgi:hypothetical protein
MLFSRRKRPTAVEPAAAEASVRSNGDAPDEPSEIPTLEIPGVATPGVDRSDPEPATALSVGPVPPSPPPAATPEEPPATEAPVTGLPSTPRVAPPPSLATDDIGLPAEGSSPETGEVTSDDLERFFAALRQVVQDARDRLPLEHEPLDTEAEPEAKAESESRVDDDTDSDTATEFQLADAAGEAVGDAPDDVEGDAPPPGTIVATQAGTEVAPSTAELIASLEADRDRWRERAVVWRERAMGADLLVKTLNAHMSDLQVNLEDLRAAMRMLGNARNAPDDPPAITGPTPPNRGVITRFLESGK